MALRDIRISSTDLKNAGYGQGTYGCASVIPSSKLAVWTTRYESLGSPIQSIRILNSRSAPKGWEPANTFAGGSACNLSTDYFVGINREAPKEKKSITMPSSGKFLYFLPSVTYTEGTSYIAGVTNLPAHWEYVLSTRDYNTYPNGDLRHCDFNTYVVPKVGKWHMSDHRIYMFVRHENGSVKSGAAVRQNPDTIYKYGNIKQKKK